MKRTAQLSPLQGLPVPAWAGAGMTGRCSWPASSTRAWPALVRIFRAAERPLRVRCAGQAESTAFQIAGAAWP
jgi:hypothetical protein